jgi:hypothetical protein
MKRIIAAILVLAMALSLCGCKKSTNMKLLAHYGGYGIAGQDLGSGSYEIEIKNLKEGDYIYELEQGELTKKCDPENQKTRWILKIDSIDDEYVKFTARQTFRTSYDEMGINSPTYVADGINYYYTVISVSGGREPYMQNW